MRLTNVKLCRLERHLLQMQVAKCAEIACSRLADIENGNAEARPDELERIASALGVSTRELLGLPLGSIPDCAAAPAAPGLDLTGEIGLLPDSERGIGPELQALTIHPTWLTVTRLLNP